MYASLPHGTLIITSERSASYNFPNILYFILLSYPNSITVSFSLLLGVKTQNLVHLPIIFVLFDTYYY